MGIKSADGSRSLVLVTEVDNCAPYHSLILSFLKPPANRQVAVGALGCPKGFTICCFLVAVAQVGRDSSVLNLLCAKDQANENCEHRSGIYRYSGRL